ncbi:putative polyribonucleotide nucleotidyltransferase [Zostera marina]|uniref:Putative polyribonucleotide nucleotidyltransferase n=1 Tax=Zostera marina TaxID=29655 RepID=A0A0K9PZM4_ZOSMR|nr:putative polyribonucleotide nucleotidyltransferase [Zostera marina]
MTHELVMVEEGDDKRVDGRTPNQMRPLSCSRNVLHRAHGSARWSQGETSVLASVYGPKSGTRKGENPEKASIEVIWKPRTGQIGKTEKEYEMILKGTLQNIIILTENPNTTTSVTLQVMSDDGSLLSCGINAACAALLDAGVQLKQLAIAICCGLTNDGTVLLDPSKIEETKVRAFACFAITNSPLSALSEVTPGSDKGKSLENGIVTSITYGSMQESDFFHCLERGRAATSRISEFLRKNLKS